MNVRIEKHLSDSGIASRRESKRIIEQGLVKVNDLTALVGQRVDPRVDKISVDTASSPQSFERTTVAVYKPRGVLSSKDQGTGKNIFDVFPQFKHLHTVGRLDKESEGLILLSDDGLITKAITSSDHIIEKEYVVTTRETIIPWMMQKMSKGMELEDGWTLPAVATKTGPNKFNIILKEGRKHQIRRMANACRLTIESLKRIRVHTISNKGMIAGNFKKVDEATIQELRTIAQKK